MGDNDSSESKPPVKDSIRLRMVSSDDGVQSCGGFVKKHDLRTSHQGPGQSGPPDHPPADLRWILILCGPQSPPVPESIKHPAPNFLVHPILSSP